MWLVAASPFPDPGTVIARYRELDEELRRGSARDQWLERVAAAIQAKRGS